MAADYAIGQFRFLEQLLLIHGRYSYKHIGFMVKYYVSARFSCPVTTLLHNACRSFTRILWAL